MSLSFVFSTNTEKGSSLGETFSQETQEVFKKQPTQVTANIHKTDTSNWRVFAGDS